MGMFQFFPHTPPTLDNIAREAVALQNNLAQFQREMRWLRVTSMLLLAGIVWFAIRPERHGEVIVALGLAQMFCLLAAGMTTDKRDAYAAALGGLVPLTAQLSAETMKACADYQFPPTDAYCEAVLAEGRRFTQEERVMLLRVAKDRTDRMYAEHLHHLTPLD